MTLSEQCYCDECSGLLEPPTFPDACYFPNPDVRGELCGEYEDHPEGAHGNWFVPPPGVTITAPTNP